MKKRKTNTKPGSLRGSGFVRGIVKNHNKRVKNDNRKSNNGRKTSRNNKLVVPQVDEPVLDENTFEELASYVGPLMMAGIFGEQNIFVKLKVSESKGILQQVIERLTLMTGARALAGKPIEYDKFVLKYVFDRQDNDGFTVTDLYNEIKDKAPELAEIVADSTEQLDLSLFTDLLKEIA